VHQVYQQVGLAGLARRVQDEVFARRNQAGEFRSVDPLNG
jgi:hypothetical protein